MDLPSYIQQIGDEEAARLFKVTRRQVATWRYKLRRPKIKKALEIERITRGKVRVEDIYSGELRQ